MKAIPMIPPSITRQPERAPHPKYQSFRLISFPPHEGQLEAVIPFSIASRLSNRSFYVKLKRLANETLGMLAALAGLAWSGLRWILRKGDREGDPW